MVVSTRAPPLESLGDSAMARMLKAPRLAAGDLPTFSLEKSLAFPRSVVAPLTDPVMDPLTDPVVESLMKPMLLVADWPLPAPWIVVQ